MDRVIRKHRLSAAEKEANNKQYYRDEIDNIDKEGSSTSYGGISEQKRMKVNYDLYNNILHEKDFEYVCQPYGSEVGELPAKMVNRDIVSGRIKAVEGMEMKRPFPWKPIAVNRDATTRKEQETFGRMREFVIAEIMKPIREEIEAKHAEQAKGKKLTQEELQQIQAQIAEELQAKTPPQVMQFMERDYQDPAEVMAHQILMYLIQEQNIKIKFQKGWKHAQLSAHEVYYVGIINYKPVLKVVNSMLFNCDRSPDLEFIEDGDWASARYRATPTEVVKMFPELTEKQIDDIFENYAYYQERAHEDSLFSYEVEEDFHGNYVRLLHATWKGLRKIGFLTYIDENGEEQMDYVDENYRLNLDAGDIRIDWEWIPEVYEGWKIGSDIYVGMGPVPGQFKDLNNLYESKLPYKGVIYDNLNSEPTSTMDRMKIYQYYYNIVMYRLELLLASDKGKKILMNLKAIPSESGIDIAKWQYFFESTPFMWFNPDEEGGSYQDANTIAKTIDMSMVSDIGKYIEFAEYLKAECGKSVGITDVVLGDIQASAEVGNTRQQLMQTSNILEPMFNLHNQAKRNVLQALIETAKVAYSQRDPGVLSYILDDMSHKFFEIDQELLDNSTIGIFVTDSAQTEEAKELIRQLGHAAMQNDTVKLSNVIKVLRQDNPQEAEEILAAAEKQQDAKEAKEAQANRESAERIEQMRIEDKQADREHDINKIDTEYAHKKELELQKQAMLSMGFNEDKDMDKDGTPDVLEIYRHGKDTEIKNKEIDLKRDTLNHQKMVDKEKLDIERIKANKTKTK